METAVKDIAGIHSKLRNSFRVHKRTFNLSFRLSQLYSISLMLQQHHGDLLKALMDDGKCETEAVMGDLLTCEKECAGMISSLSQWVADEGVSLEFALVASLDSAVIRRDPLGVVLIIGTWNYPVNTVLCPLIGAIAGGNCACVKLSEVSVNVARVLSQLLPRYLDPDSFSIVTGGVAQSTALLKHEWDHIFYTGNGHVGRIIARAAAEHLTPCTLELGGKSPVFVDETVDITTFARRLILGKCFNAGQTCIAPDYLLCPAGMQSELVEAMHRVVDEMYGGVDRMDQSADYGKIINEHHYMRLLRMLEKTHGKIVLGGKTDAKSRFISPTVIAGVKRDDSLMKEEIFGPLLPIITCETVQEACEFINSGDKPLSAYLFSSKSETIEYYKKNVLSGGMVINGLLVHFAVSDLPFGGVGASGHGHYHGKYSVETFTHAKSILWRSLSMPAELSNQLRYPPYQPWKVQVLKTLLVKQPTDPKSWWFKPE
jgi:acyl-CoA reductase-like NAD-dependent aldehyde dehydrogenase